MTYTRCFYCNKPLKIPSIKELATKNQKPKKKIENAYMIWWEQLYPFHPIDRTYIRRAICKNCQRKFDTALNLTKKQKGNMRR